MSANNQLLIHINKEGFYQIDNVDVDNGGGFLVGKEETLESAIKKANEYMSEEIVEYGLDIRI